MLNQFAVEIPTLPVDQCPSREGPPSIWDTHGKSGNVFATPDASSSAPYPQELNPWGTTIEEPRHMSRAEKSERQTQDRDQRCQSGPSAKNSVIFSGGDSSRNMEQTNNGCCWTPRSPQETRELCARPLVLTPVLVQAIQSLACLNFTSL